MNKKIILSLCVALWSSFAYAQDNSNTYWQVKVDFLEPIVNQGFIVRADHGMKRSLLGVYAGGLGKVSEFDNAQFDTYEDKTNFLLGLEYQYFLSEKKQNKGFYVGGDVMYANRSVASKISNEEVNNISVLTPGVWLGWVWKPFKTANLIVDLTILHPRYDLGAIKKVDFQTVNTPYEPENLFNFLGPWSIGWRF